MKNNIKKIPILFLFAPILVAVLGLFSFFSLKFTNAIETQLKLNAGHVINHVGDISRPFLEQQQTDQLKQALWHYAQNSELALDNIVIYDKVGLFVTALNLTPQAMDTHLSVFPEQPYAYQDNYFHVYGRIGHQLQTQALLFDDKTIGFVRISYDRESVRLTDMSDKLIIALLAILCLVLGSILWRYRYAGFHHQLTHTHDYLVKLNKGYKQSKLVDSSAYVEIDDLQQQINALVGFYEKRLTMKQFEITAIEQSLSEANQCFSLTNNQLAEVLENQQKMKNNGSSLVLSLYQVLYQTLQAQLAVIEEAVGESKIERQTSQVTQAINQLNQLLGELKQLADTPLTQANYPLEFISLKPLIASICQFISPLAHQKALEFIVCQPDELIEVEINISKIQKVLLALIQCGVTATNKGYVKLTVEVLTPDDDELVDGMQLLCCKVLDTGVGLTENQYEMLLSDTVDSTLSDDCWINQGLSLMVAKKTIESMGGDFKVRSLSGLGTELSLSVQCHVHRSEDVINADYHGYSMLIYAPHEQSGTVIYEKLCGQGVLAVLCSDERQVITQLSKGTIDCCVFVRPVEPSLKQVFDQSLAVITASYPLDKCLFLSAEQHQLPRVPESWLVVEKPFVLSVLNEYFPCTRSAPQIKQDNSVVNCAVEKLKGQHKIVILAVDDNETNLKLLSVVLRGYPVKLVQANSGREALILSQEQSFDVILMDKEMPQMNGIQTSMQIRKLPLNKHTPIVILSAHVDDCEREHMSQLGIDDCMEKPLDQDKFYFLMDNYCHQRWQWINSL